MKINVHSMILKCMLLIPLSTLFSAFSFVSILNKLLAMFMILGLLYSMFRSCSRQTILVVVITGVVYLYSLWQTHWPIHNINELFYLAFWVLFFNDFVDNRELYNKKIIKNIKMMSTVTLVWNVFTFISIFIGSCYEENIFFSFSGAQHRFASCALQVFAMAILLMKITKKKKYLLLAIVPAYTIMLTGARTYMVVTAIAIVCVCYLVIKHKGIFYITIIPAILLGTYYVMNSAVMIDRASEIARLSDYLKDPLGALTSGRSVWWIIDLKHIFASSIQNQMMGNGFHFIRYVNTNFYGSNIWAHNDYIMLLGTNGWIGVLVYLYSYFRICNLFIKGTTKKGWLVLGFHGMNFINAFFNMLYTYFSATLAVPLFLIVFFDSDFGVWSEGSNIS